MSKIFSMFYFPTKIQDGRQKWRKLNFFPLCIGYSCTTLPVKIRLKTIYLLRFSRYSHIFIFRKNPRWPPKVAKIEFFPLCIGYSCTALRVKNSLEIALSLTVFEIFTLFRFPAKIQNGRQKWRKLKFFPLCIRSSCTTCGSKIRSKSLYLLRFSRYSHFFVFHKNPRWLPKVVKIEIFPLCIG